MGKPAAHRVQAPRTRPQRAPRKGASGALRSRKTLYLGAVVVAAAVAAALLALSIAGGRSNKPTTVAGASESAALLHGIPQRGTVLGAPDAPLRLVEYADLQCTFCARWSRDVLPTLVELYVRPGKLQIEFRGLAFVGPESEIALRTALAATGQNRLWDVVELLYRNQGDENSGWVNDKFMGSVLASVDGLDGARVLEERDGGAVTGAMSRAAAQATAAGVTGTPSFGLARTGEQLQRLDVAALDVPSFAGPLDAALAE